MMTRGLGENLQAKGKKTLYIAKTIYKYKEDIHKSKNRMQVLPFKIVDKRPSSV